MPFISPIVMAMVLVGWPLIRIAHVGIDIR
jgi:hypothetical protein